VLATAGADGLRTLVLRHHMRLRQSEIGHLFATDDTQFAKLVGHIADYVIETCGGPQKFTEERGARLTHCASRHLPSPSTNAREVWLENLFHAMEETGFPLVLREEYWAWLEAMSIRMINRRRTKAQPMRISWAEANARYREAVAA